MTTATDAPATPDADATLNAEREAKRQAVQASLDDFGRMALERIVGQVNERNSDVDRLSSLGGDRVTRLDSMRADLAEGKGDANLVALQKQIKTLEEKLGDLCEQRDKALNVVIDKEIANSDVDPKALEEAIKTADSSIRTGLNYLKGLYGDDVTLLIPDLKGRRGVRTGGSSGGSGKRRLRGFEVTVDGVRATSPDKDGVQKSSFSAAAKVLGYKSVDDLSSVYRERNGDDPDKFPAEDTFTVKDADGKDRVVKAVRA